MYTLKVSWIRKRDLHILTVGTATYTSDKRFHVSFIETFARSKIPEQGTI